MCRKLEQPILWIPGDAVSTKAAAEFIREYLRRGIGEPVESRRETPKAAKVCSEPGSDVGSATETMAPSG